MDERGCGKLQEGTHVMDKAAQYVLYKWPQEIASDVPFAEILY